MTQSDRPLTISHADVTSGAPLSFAQQRLWFLDQLTPNTATYNIPLVVDLEGPLVVGALRRALTEIVRRHGALRTTFPSPCGVPRQVVEPPHEFPLPEADLSALDADRMAAEADAVISTEVRRPFDLARGPVFHARLLRLGPERHVLVASVHHIVFDGWSTGIFFRELPALYRSYVAGEPAALVEPAARYVDFAAWQRERLQGETLHRELEYWKKQVRDAPRLAMPTDFRRPAVQTPGGSRQYDFLSEDLVRAAAEFSRRESVTLFITMLSAYATLLHGYCGQDDLLIGIPIANRAKRELESVVGFFLNMLPLRLDLSGDPTFRSLVRRTRQRAFGAYAHQELPFEKLVEELRPERSFSHGTVLDTIFVLDNNPGAVSEAIVAGDLTLKRRVVETGTTKFDVGLALFPQEGGLRASIEYSTDLFEPATGGRLLRHYRRILEGFLADPDRRIRELVTPSDEERALVTQRWSGWKSPFPREATIADLFEAETRRAPEGAALADDRRTLTYADLNARANQLARHLRSAGVVPGDPVGVCIERSRDTIITLLAIVKAGAAYVPIPPSDPPERIRSLTRRVNCKAVVTRSTLASALDFGIPRVIALEAQAQAIAALSPDNLGISAGAESLAYVLFTSGSTGEPKAVGVGHRAIARLVYGMPEVPLGAGARVLHASPLAFDLSTLEIWGPLLRGGCVVVAPDRLHTPHELERLLNAQRVSVLWLTSSLFNVVIDEHPAALKNVRHVITGGEALSVSHVERALAALPDTTFINGYGPTEATTFATYFVIPRDGRPRPSIPIGRPLPNTRVYVLDDREQPVPPGFPGDLWIGGDALASGYLTDAAMTAERFRPDPFAGGVARMYKSGDRARFLDDGTLEFLGRIDDQLKIRGFRVEPGEVEAALMEHPLVDRAVVAAQELPGHGRVLVAYVVGGDTGSLPSPAQLRIFLKTRVPDHMVPQFYEPLAALPLLPSGKVDRRALKAPALDHAAGTTVAGGEPVKPAERAPVLTKLERQLSEIWGSVLELPAVDPDADFFELGGHSLLAVRLSSEVESRLGTTVPISAFFEHGTIRKQARFIERSDQPAEWSPIVGIQPNGTRSPLFLVHGIGGEVLSYAALAKHLGQNQPTYGLRAKVEEREFFSSVEDIAAAYIRGIRQVAPRGPYRIGGYSAGGVIAYEIAQQLRGAGDDVPLLAIIDCWAPGTPHDEISTAALWHLMRSAAYWVVDDDFFRDGGAARARLRSKVTNWRQRFRATTGRAKSEDIDIRHAQGLWQFPESSRQFLAALDQALRTYRPHPYAGSMTVIRSRTPRLVRFSARKPDLGWQRLVAGRVQTRLVAGAHDTIVQEPRVRKLAEVLSQCLDGASV